VAGHLPGCGRAPSSRWPPAESGALDGGATGSAAGIGRRRGRAGEGMLPAADLSSYILRPRSRRGAGFAGEGRESTRAERPRSCASRSVASSCRRRSSLALSCSRPEPPSAQAGACRLEASAAQHRRLRWHQRPLARYPTPTRRSRTSWWASCGLWPKSRYYWTPVSAASSPRRSGWTANEIDRPGHDPRLWPSARNALVALADDQGNWRRRPL
jgi:hypothetical protein